jgi:hypothetical protein
LHLYSAAYNLHHDVPVRSILVLLRPAADQPRLTGKLTYQCGGCDLQFKYEVVRQWRQPLAPYLTGGLALLPLAPLCELPTDVPLEEALRDVIHQVDNRLAEETTYARAIKLMTATFILTGLRVKQQSLGGIFSGVKIMHESSAFTLYEEKGRQEGRVEESHRVLLRQGRNRFGTPDAASESALRSIHDIDRLERMADAVLTAKSWAELLATA